MLPVPLYDMLPTRLLDIKIFSEGNQPVMVPSHSWALHTQRVNPIKLITTLHATDYRVGQACPLARRLRDDQSTTTMAALGGDGGGGVHYFCGNITHPVREMPLTHTPSNTCVGRVKS